MNGIGVKNVRANDDGSVYSVTIDVPAWLYKSWTEQSKPQRCFDCRFGDVFELMSDYFKEGK